MSAGKPARAIPFPVLITLALCSGFAPFAIDTYLVGLPAIADDLDASASLTQVTLTGFLLALGLMQLVIGPLSDQKGRRRLMLGGLAGAALASVLCAVAPNIWVLIVGRILQGGFGAAGVVLARATVGDLGRGIGVAKAFSLLMSVQSVAPIVAPLIGGLLIPTMGWRSVFWFLAILSGSLFVAAFVLVPESLPEAERSEAGIKSSLRGVGALLVRKRYMAPLTLFVASFVVMFAYIAASPFVLQRIGGMSQQQYSLTFTINAFMLLVTNLFNARVVPRLGPVRILRSAVYLSGAAVVWLAFSILVLDSAAWAVAGGFFLVVAAAGLILPNASALSVEASEDRRGSGSALLGAIQFTSASVIAPLTGLGDGTTAVPMLVVMVAGLAAQLVCMRLLSGEDRKKRYG